MTTLGEIINEISKIRDTLDTVEVKGYENRVRLNDAYEKCSNLIEVIVKAVQELQNAGKNKEESQKEEEG